MNNPSFDNKKILVITHFFATGPSQELMNFLKDKTSILGFIEHPFSYANRNYSLMELYKKGKLFKKKLSPKFAGPDILWYIKDFFFTIFFAFKLEERFYLCIAADNLNALAAIFLKKVGVVKKVIYFTIDYTPQRFTNKILNNIYHQIDKYCCYHADFIWNSSEVMIKQREKKGILEEKSAPQITVEDGSNFEKIKRLPFAKINRNDIVFMGHLRKNKGIEMLLEVFSEVCLKVKKARLIIIGGGELEQKLKKQAKKLKIKDRIIFTGYVPSHSRIEEMMTKCAVSVAPYVPDLNSFSFYSDVGKAKAYLACGLPVIITKVPKIAWEIEKEKAGIAVNYDKEEIKEAIIKLLTKDSLYKKMRENAVKFGSNFTWEKTFNNAFVNSFSRFNKIL